MDGRDTISVLVNSGKLSDSIFIEDDKVPPSFFVDDCCLNCEYSILKDLNPMFNWNPMVYMRFT